MNETDIINILRNSFSNDAIKRHVLDENWCQENIDNGIDSTGFCFGASEVLYLPFDRWNKYLASCINKRPKRLGQWNTVFFLNEDRIAK